MMVAVCPLGVSSLTLTGRRWTKYSNHEHEKVTSTGLCGLCTSVDLKIMLCKLNEPHPLFCSVTAGTGIIPVRHHKT